MKTGTLLLFLVSLAARASTAAKVSTCSTRMTYQPGTAAPLSCPILCNFIDPSTHRTPEPSLISDVEVLLLISFFITLVGIAAVYSMRRFERRERARTVKTKPAPVSSSNSTAPSVSPVPKKAKKEKSNEKNRAAKEEEKCDDDDDEDVPVDPEVRRKYDEVRRGVADEFAKIRADAGMQAKAKADHQYSWECAQKKQTVVSMFKEPTIPPPNKDLPNNVILDNLTYVPEDNYNINFGSEYDDIELDDSTIVSSSDYISTRADASLRKP